MGRHVIWKGIFFSAFSPSVPKDVIAFTENGCRSGSCVFKWKRTGVDGWLQERWYVNQKPLIWHRSKNYTVPGYTAFWSVLCFSVDGRKRCYVFSEMKTEVVENVVVWTWTQIRFNLYFTSQTSLPKLLESSRILLLHLAKYFIIHNQFRTIDFNLKLAATIHLNFMRLPSCYV